MLGERTGWDTLIWFGGLVGMATMLSKLGMFKWFAGYVSTNVTGMEWLPALVLIVLLQVVMIVIAYARQKGLLVILDAKRNDIGSTAEAYADGLLVELVLTDGRDYSGYEVDLVTDEGFVITYGDYDDERVMHRVTVLGEYRREGSPSRWTAHEPGRLSARSAYAMLR